MTHRKRNKRLNTDEPLIRDGPETRKKQRTNALEIYKVKRKGEN